MAAHNEHGERPAEVLFGERLTRRDHLRRSAMLSGPGLLWVVIFLFLPLLFMVGISVLSRGSAGEISPTFTWENFQRFAGFGELGFDPMYPTIILRSLVLGLATTAICLVMAFPLTFFIAGLRSPLKNLALTLVIIPLWTNLLIRTYAWQILLAGDGWLARAAAWVGLTSAGQALYPGTLAVYTGMVCDFLPFLVLPLYASVEKMDWSIVEAAMDLGANGWRVFQHAVLPQVKPGVAAGCILTFIPAMGTFVIPDLLGGSKTMLLGNAIQQQFGPSRDWPFGAAITLLAVIIVMLGLWLFYRLDAKRGEGMIL